MSSRNETLSTNDLEESDKKVWFEMNKYDFMDLNQNKRAISLLQASICVNVDVDKPTSELYFADVELRFPLLEGCVFIPHSQITSWISFGTFSILLL